MHGFLTKHTKVSGIRAVIDAYRLYLEHVTLEPGVEAPLSFTRAWMLVRFFDSGMLQLSRCGECGGHFVAHAHDPQANFVCAICRPPPRAGKTRAAAKRAEKAAIKPTLRTTEKG